MVPTVALDDIAGTPWLSQGVPAICRNLLLARLLRSGSEEEPQEATLFTAVAAE